MPVLGYLPKLKRDLGLAFGAHKNVPFIKYSINGQSFNAIPFFLLKI